MNPSMQGGPQGPGGQGGQQQMIQMALQIGMAVLQNPQLMKIVLPLIQQMAQQRQGGGPPPGAGGPPNPQNPLAGQ